MAAVRGETRPLLPPERDPSETAEEKEPWVSGDRGFCNSMLLLLWPLAAGAAPELEPGST
eukprot:CAMPEP_0197542878 /NCGR_PEP_ID=MMETSP1318-20131121/67938_1 /TAXON_ID=552666 /ORGANISM="Partenskyella glossopodia, Strain RCC365" /LENGTH=59 /DNA_ID=CAMNT_0043102171 /DNA_START=251 /DNA_END=430 /DNA_ORIENTATION=-